MGKVRGGREGGRTQGEKEDGRTERKRDSLAQFQGYHWQPSSHLPAASLKQQHMARRMLPCAASAGCLLFCGHALECCTALRAQHVKAVDEDHVHNQLDGLYKTHTSLVTAADPQPSRCLCSFLPRCLLPQPLKRRGKPLKMKTSTKVSSFWQMMLKYILFMQDIT